MTDFHPDEIVANLVAYGMLEDTFEIVEQMLATGPNPPAPANQDVLLKQIADVRKRVMEGKARPALTHVLTKDEQVQRFLDEKARHDTISGLIVADPTKAAEYVDELAPMAAKEAGK